MFDLDILEQSVIIHPEYDKKTTNNQMINVTQKMKPKDYWIMLVQN